MYYIVSFLVLLLFSLFMCLWFGVFEDFSWCKVFFLNYYFFGSLGGTSMTFSIIFDFYSIMFMVVILLISAAILLYSTEYMNGDRSSIMFLVLMLMFICSMGAVVFSSNLVAVMLGWDGLGLVSFLLVVFYQNMKSTSSSLITALSNRIGDGMILLSISIMYEHGSWDYGSLVWGSENSWVLSGLVVLAAITKSAQYPFSAWLPRAMAAPTPVSALVHSSTLVTAGLYLLFRLYPLLLKMNFLPLFLGLGFLTMMMASVNACYENDIKKIIALSTLSQLGLMFCSLGIGLPVIMFFHLITHAFFKALLFMCSGVIIHNSGELQDIRHLGGCTMAMPLTTVLMGGCSLALCGFPFMSGFYSKDSIMEMGYHSVYSVMYLFTMSLSVGLSGSYCWRLVSLGLGQYWKGSTFHSLGEPKSYMFFSKFYLFLLVVTGGTFLSYFLLSSPTFVILSFSEKVLTFFSTALGVIIAIYLTERDPLSDVYFEVGQEDGSSDLAFLSTLTGDVSSYTSSCVVHLSLLTEETASNMLAGKYMEGFITRIAKFFLSLISKDYGLHLWSVVFLFFVFII